MRPVLSTDLICAGRAVLQARGHARVNLARSLVSAARIADNYRLRTGALHPDFGDGTLAAAARKQGMAAERTLCDPEFSEALIEVLLAINPSDSGTHRVLR